MTKQELLLAALAAGGKSEHSPVQIQKLIFLLEKNISTQLGGPFFEFKPYDYGPFDSSIYDLLRQLETEGLVGSTESGKGWKRHHLTDTGISKSESILQNLDTPVVDYIAAVSNFVRSLSFVDLVSSIYKAYPEMKVNSIFKDS
jgi:uncharacterized protein